MTAAPKGALRRFYLLSAIAGAFFGTLSAQTTAPIHPRKSMEESIAKQKASIRKQAGAAPQDGFFTTAWLTPPPAFPAPPACDPLPDDQTAPLIAKVSTEAKLEAALLREVIRRESGFRPCAVSGKGAMGMMQLMPATAGRFRVADPFDAAQNVAAGAKYLKELLDRFGGELKLALAAYNAGPETVEKSKPETPDIPETRDYVEAILKALRDDAQ